MPFSTFLQDLLRVSVGMLPLSQSLLSDRARCLLEERMGRPAHLTNLCSCVLSQEAPSCVQVQSNVHLIGWPVHVCVESLQI